MKKLLVLAPVFLVLLPLAAFGQNETPAVDDMPLVDTEQSAPPPKAMPKAGAPAATPAKPADAPDEPGVHKAASGTTVIGEQDSPIGLYITPWRNSAAAGGLDRPARLLDEALLPLDPDVFKRQVEYHRALSEHLSKTGRATP
jgi:hypothetical protein